MVGCIGDDDFGRALRAALAPRGLTTAAVRTVAGVPTGIAMITVDQAGENMITVAPGANHEVGAAEIADAVGHREPCRDRGRGGGAVGDVLVISAEVPVPVITAALAASAGRALRVLNLAPAPPARRPSSSRPAPTGWW